MSANDYQVGGDHYKAAGKTEHWDFVWQHNLDYFQGQITKYVIRWKRKGGLRDLEKARHFLEKYIELVKGSTEDSTVAMATHTTGQIQTASGGYGGHSPTVTEALNKRY